MNIPAIASQEPTGLIPVTMRDAMDLANMMAKSTVVPTAFRGKPADCLLVIMQAVRWQMDPFAVIQECSMIRDRLFYSGKLTAAVINTRGRFLHKLSYGYEGKGDDRTVTISGHLQGENEPRTVRVRLGDAKTENKAWQTQTEQQLGYHGARVWGRRHMPELMLGVYSPEEDWKTIEHDPPAEADDEPAEDERTSDEIDTDLAAAAEQGMLELERRWHSLPKQQQSTFKAALDRRYKPTAQQADATRENETDAVKQCVMRCKDTRFQKYLEETNTAWGIMKEGTPAERAAELVRSIVGVKSRKDLATNREAREHWFDLDSKFQSWLRL